ncbi:MAG: hypothetical protein RL757_2639 [Bacteroidota bacterium]|jgi:hypothetical protein
MKKIFICQSNYVPWWGYFDAIRQADAFVTYDEVQYTRLDWRNRNRIKTPRGLQWLSIPMQRWKLGDPISTVRVQPNWQTQHLNLLRENYRTAPHFKTSFDFLENVYQQSQQFSYLTDINHLFLKVFCEKLEIETPFFRSHECPKNEFRVETDDQRSGRLLQICLQLGATHYLSGRAAEHYLNVPLFNAHQIEVEWLQYAPPQYPQLFGDFESGVSMIDAFFNTGNDAKILFE